MSSLKLVESDGIDRPQPALEHAAGGGRKAVGREMVSVLTHPERTARRPIAGVALILATLALALIAACDAGAPEPESRPTVPASASPAAPAAGSLREFDFESEAFVAELLARAGGGEVHAERVQLEDLTGDGREEAVVVVESGGTAGDIGVAVYGWVEGEPALLFFRPLAGHVEVRLGLVVIQEGVYAAGEPRCCPSRLREFVYGWREGEFALLSEQVVDNPRR